MKVLYSLDSINRGGAEFQTLDVFKNSKRFGIGSIVVANGGGSLEKEFNQAGKSFIRLQRKLPIDLGLIRKLRKIIKENSIQIVHGYQPVEGLHLYFATLGLPVKKVLSFQGFISDRKNRLATKFLIPRMDANIVVSKGLKNWLEKVDNLQTNKSFTVIYNGADPKRLLPKGNSLKQELGLSENTKLLGMIGNFYADPRKDQLTLCKALPKIFEEVENAHCIFVGRVENGTNDRFEECLKFCEENGIAKKVHFLGERRDIPDILASIDIFVFSSLYEGLPVAATEAMLSKVPLIVSDIEPLLEISKDGEFAEVFKTQDEKQLSDQAIKLLKDDVLRKDLRNRAYQFALDNFSIDAHLTNLKNLYNSLL